MNLNSLLFSKAINSAAVATSVIVGVGGSGGVSPLSVTSTFCTLQWPEPDGRVKITEPAEPVQIPVSGSYVPTFTTSAVVGLFEPEYVTVI